MEVINSFGGGRVGPSTYEIYVDVQTSLGRPVLTKAEWLNAQKGPYQAWLDAGNEGTEAEYLASVARIASFPDRATLRSYAATNAEKMPGSICNVEGVFFEYAEGAGAIPDLPGFVPSGDITPFHFGLGLKGWQHEINAAIAYAMSTGRQRVCIPAGIRKSISLTAPFDPVSDVEIYGIGNPEIEVASSVVFEAENVESFSFRDITIIGPYTGTSYLLSLGEGCRRCHVDVTFVGTNSGAVVTDASDNIVKVAGRNVRGTTLKISGAKSVRNRVPLVVAENVTGFGVLIEKGASFNRIDAVHKFVNLDDLPDAQKAGTQWDAATGRLGLEALGITIGCSRNSAGSVVAIDTHDNGVSITGTYNTVEDVTAENCDHEGVHFYGDCNAVGFLRAFKNRMSGAGAGGSNTDGGGNNNTILNGVAIQNGYYAARFSMPAADNDFRLRSIANELGDSYSVAGAGPNNAFNAYPNALDTSRQSVKGDLGQIVQTVTSSSYAPQISQVRKYDDGADVVSGSLLGRWDVFGWLTGVAKQAVRISAHATSVANGILRAKFRFNVVNAEGVLRPAMVIDMNGRVGIANSAATEEYAPLAELDVDGVTRLSALTLKSTVLAEYAGAAIDVSSTSSLHISTVAGGATLGALTTSAAGNQLLVIKNTTSSPLTIKNASNGVRTASGKDVVLGAFKSILLEQASGSVWDEVGVYWPSGSLSTPDMTVEGSGDSIQQTVVADGGSPVLNQRRRLVSGEGDVTPGSVIAKWTGAGWAGGAYRFASRMTWFVHEVIGTVVRAKMKINVTNAAGVDWAAFHFSEQGYLGIGDPATFTERDPLCSLDVAGHSRFASLGLNDTAYANYDGSPLDATGKGVLSISPVAAGTRLGVLTSDSVGFQFLVIRNTSSNTLTVPHSTGGFRLNGKADMTLGAHETVLLMHITGAVWQQI